MSSALSSCKGSRSNNISRFIFNGQPANRLFSGSVRLPEFIVKRIVCLFRIQLSMSDCPMASDLHLDEVQILLIDDSDRILSLSSFPDFHLIQTVEFHGNFVEGRTILWLVCPTSSDEVLVDAILRNEQSLPAHDECLDAFRCEEDILVVRRPSEPYLQKANGK